MHSIDGIKSLPTVPDSLSEVFVTLRTGFSRFMILTVLHWKLYTFYAPKSGYLYFLQTVIDYKQNQRVGYESPAAWPSHAPVSNQYQRETKTKTKSKISKPTLILFSKTPFFAKIGISKIRKMHYHLQEIEIPAFWRYYALFLARRAILVCGFPKTGGPIFRINCT